METIIGRIEQLTHERTSIAIPASKITIPLEPDTTALDEAQKKADKLKVTLLEVQELIRQNNSIINCVKEQVIDEITRALEMTTTCHTMPLQEHETETLYSARD